ncbi:glycoside hydrolase superfamily [Biscogniauxia mediterranea]|nr:glycoside hydrolase superfamily [Biscogniauxia mediterranea]
MRPIGISFSLLSLLHLSVGQHRHHHVHRHRANRDPVLKRDRITVTDTAFPSQTEVPEVVVYVDQNGNPIRTATETVVYVPASTKTLQPSAAPTSQVAPPPPAVSVASVEQPTPAVSNPSPPPPPASTELAPKPSPSSQNTAPPAPPAQTPSTSALKPAPSPSASSSPPPAAPGGKDLHGITYSPYKSSGGCKSADEVDTDFALFAKDYGVIRLYGVDCDQVASAYKAAKKYGNKLFLGIFDISNVDQAVSTISAGVDNDWAVVDTVSVGNELVNNGEASVSQSLGALGEVRSALRAAGYQGPVVVVDTFVAVLAHPEICDQSDYCAVNIHPFFDPNTGADQAGSFVTSMVARIRSRISDKNKRIVVTETGWPWQGNGNGVALPGMDQQASALASIKGAYTSNAKDLILFTAFNDLWKKPEAGTFMAEQFWGMGGRYSPCDE